LRRVLSFFLTLAVFLIGAISAHAKVSVTIIGYNAAGAPTGKLYADASGESYVHTPGGLLVSISLARGGSLQFGYSNDGAKDLISAAWPTVTSGDFTIPALAEGYGYDRAGRINSLTDSSGTRSLAYQNGRLQQTAWSSGALAGYSVVKTLDEYGRDAGFTLQRGATVIHSAVKVHNDVSGEISEITSGVLKVVLDRDGARRITGFQWGNATGTFVPAVTQSWTRGIAGRVEAANSNLAGAPAFVYLIDGQPDSYSFDSLGRRLKCATAGGEWTYQYGTAGQLTSAVHTGTISLGSFSYAFDGIGRRTDMGTANTTDLLNRTLGWTHSQSKTLTVKAAQGARVWINGSEVENFNGSSSYAVTSPGTDGGWVEWNALAILEGQGEGAGSPPANPHASPHAKAEQTGAVWVPPVSETFGFDAAGNRQSSALWDYGWDGRNKLVRARTKNHDASVRGYDITFDYDSEGRRFKKNVTTYQNGSIVSQDRITFVWDGWDLIYELHQNPSGLTTLERKYVWGPDIAGGTGGDSGAGGAGGLLLIRETRGSQTKDYYPLYDGSGQVVALTNSDKELLAEYAYGPFGELIHAKGPMAQINPIRYASKYYDAETGLYYYGERYLDPITGQWLSREPLGESESVNLYAYCHNDPVNNVDVLGLAPAGLNPEQSKIFDKLLAEWPIRERLDSDVTAKILGIMRMDGNLDDPRLEQAARLDVYETQVGDVYRKNPALINTVGGISVAAMHMIPGSGPQGAGAADGSNTTFMLAVDTFRLFAGSLIALDPGSPRSFRNEVFPAFVKGYNAKYSYGQRTGAEIGTLFAAFIAPEVKLQVGEAFSGLKGSRFGEVLNPSFTGRPGLAPGGVINPFAAESPLFRGGNGLEARLGVDVTQGADGLISPLTKNGKPQGLSLNLDPKNQFIQKYGGAFPVENLPEGLQAVQSGGAGHFVISPSSPMSFEHYQQLLNQVRLGLSNIIR
jgi:RHS repeat-associated protein